MVIDKYGVADCPYPNIALSLPYPAASKYLQAVPTPVVSVATTPVLLTKFVIDTTALPL